MSAATHGRRLRAARRLEAEIGFLARALLAETDGGPLRAVEALAACTMNRLRAVRETAPGISLPAVARRHDCFPAGLRSPRTAEAAAFDACRRIAARAASGSLPDPTRGAVRWHRLGEAPQWAQALHPSALVGERVFYGPS